MDELKKNINNNENVTKIIKELFLDHAKITSKCNTLNFYDEKNRNVIVLWMRNNVYILKEIAQIVKKYVLENKILTLEFYDIIGQNKHLINVLHEEALYKMQNCIDKEIIKQIFSDALECGFVPDKHHFIEIISNHEYLQIMSTKKIFGILKTTYHQDIFDFIIQQKNLNVDIYNIIFGDYKYNNDEIKSIFVSNNHSIISYVMSKLQFKKDVKLDESYFEIMIFYNIFEPILNLINFDYIVNLDKCFKIFWNKLEKSVVTTYSSHHSGDYISQQDFKYFLPIYKSFINKTNLFNKNHFNIFFKHNWTDFSDFLVKEKNIFPENDSFKLFVMHISNSKLFDEYFTEMICSEYHLNLACFYKKPIIVNNILNQKISPTKKCFQSLFEDISNSSSNVKLNFLTIENVNKIIDSFIWYGYFMTKEDIILATSKGIKLNDSHFTKNFILNDDEKDKFYEYCHFDFMPKYNDNLFGDVYWLRRMCKIARISHEYKQIKQYIKKTGIELDFVSYVYLSGNYYGSKEKTELMNLFIRK